MDNDKVKKYFSEKANFWLSESYDENEYAYPIGFHRTRIVQGIIKEQFGSNKINLLDIGCGGGDLCLSVVKLGHNATGMDQSEEMLKESDRKKSELSEKEASRLNFVKSNFLKNELPDESFGVVSAIGFIGYIDDDNSFFINAGRLVKKGGLLIVSCRNRLFNMTSISNYTIKEIEDGNAIELIKEIEELYGSISEEDSIVFVNNLDNSTKGLLNVLKQKKGDQKADNEYSIKSADLSSMNPRQHTPKQLNAVAETHGFMNVGSYGVHPHLMIPKLNYLLLPRVFNSISDSLCVFEKLPISLIWSSCFISVFEKK